MKYNQRCRDMERINFLKSNRAGRDVSGGSVFRVIFFSDEAGFGGAFTYTTKAPQFKSKSKPTSPEDLTYM